MGIGPRQQLYIVGGIAALFAVLTILFVILFATKKCDKCNCANAAQYGTIVAILPSGQDVNGFQTAFTNAGYTIFKLSNVGNQMLAITYTPNQDANTVMNKLNISGLQLADGSTTSLSNCIVNILSTTTSSTSTASGATTPPPPTGGPPPPATTPPPPASVTTPATGPTPPPGPTTPPPTGTTPPPPPTMPPQTTCGPVTPPTSPGTCASIVKDFVFIIDIMPDVQGNNTAKKTEIIKGLQTLSAQMTFGDTLTRFGLVGFFDATATGVDMYNNVNGFNTALNNLVNRIDTTNGGSYGNLGAAFTSVQKYQAFRPTVDTVLIIISDHPPIGLDTNNNPSTAVVTQMAVDLATAGFYIGAITPVADCLTVSLTSDCFSTVLTHYDNIVSNKYLRANGITSYDKFGDSVQGYLLRTVCGYVSGPSVPTTVAAPTQAVPPVPLLTTPNVPGTTVGPGGDPFDLKCLPVNIMFILDNSQSIDPGTFNTAVRQFVKDISLKYAFQNEIAEPSSRIGIVQFASGASVSYPLIERTRQQFLDTVDGGITYDIQGITNISLGLEVALQELNDRGIPAHDNVLVILMTDGVSTLDIKLTKPAADRMQAYTKFFAGVGVQGVNGNDISANLTNLQILIGNTALAYPDITAAEDPTTGIWHETRVFYPCPVPACKGVIFIGEMTEVIAQERKGIFLNATKSIAAYLNANPGGTNADQLQFAIGTYGNITFRKPVFQSFTDFNTVLDQLINDVAANNQPNAGQTNTGSILEDLYILLTTAKLNNYLVLFMGETERILDITVTETNVQKVLSTPAQVFVLDMTNGLWDNDYLFKRLARDANKIHNYTSGQTAADVATYYNNPSNQFAQIWNGMTCTAPADPVCNAFFDMFLVVKQSARTTKSLKYIASTLNAKYTAVSNYAGFTKRGLVYYGTGSALSNDLTFDSNGIYNLIQSLPADPNAANNYNMGYLRASDQLKISARTYGQNIIVIISDQYPASTDPQCTAVSNGQTAWNKDQKTPVVYYIPTSGPQLNQQPCPAFRVFNYTITGDPIADNPKMASIITEICSTPLPPLVCPCAGPNGIRTPPRQNFLQRYFG